MALDENALDKLSAIVAANETTENHDGDLDLIAAHYNRLGALYNNEDALSSPKEMANAWRAICSDGQIQAHEVLNGYKNLMHHADPEDIPKDSINTLATYAEYASHALGAFGHPAAWALGVFSTFGPQIYDQSLPRLPGHWTGNYSRISGSISDPRSCYSQIINLAALRYASRWEMVEETAELSAVGLPVRLTQEDAEEVVRDFSRNSQIDVDNTSAEEITNSFLRKAESELENIRETEPTARDNSYGSHDREEWLTEAEIYRLTRASYESIAIGKFFISHFLNDPEGAQKFEGIASGVTQIVAAGALMNSGLGFLSGISQMSQGFMSISTALGGGGNPNGRLIAAVLQQVVQLRKEMHLRFDFVDEQLTNVLDGIADLLEDGQRTHRNIQHEIRAATNELSYIAAVSLNQNRSDQLREFRLLLSDMENEGITAENYDEFFRVSHDLVKHTASSPAFAGLPVGRREYTGFLKAICEDGISLNFAAISDIFSHHGPPLLARAASPGLLCLVMQELSSVIFAAPPEWLRNHERRYEDIMNDADTMRIAFGEYDYGATARNASNRMFLDFGDDIRNWLKDRTSSWLAKNQKTKIWFDSELLDPSLFPRSTNASLSVDIKYGNNFDDFFALAAKNGSSLIALTRTQGSVVAFAGGWMYGPSFRAFPVLANRNLGDNRVPNDAILLAHQMGAIRLTEVKNSAVTTGRRRSPTWHIDLGVKCYHVSILAGELAGYESINRKYSGFELLEIDVGKGGREAKIYHIHDGATFTDGENTRQLSTEEFWDYLLPILKSQNAKNREMLREHLIGEFERFPNELASAKSAATIVDIILAVCAYSNGHSRKALDAMGIGEQAVPLAVDVFRKALRRSFETENGAENDIIRPPFLDTDMNPSPDGIAPSRDSGDMIETLPARFLDELKLIYLFGIDQSVNSHDPDARHELEDAIFRLRSARELQN